MARVSERLKKLRRALKDVEAAKDLILRAEKKLTRATGTPYDLDCTDDVIMDAYGELINERDELLQETLTPDVIRELQSMMP